MRNGRQIRFAGGLSMAWRFRIMRKYSLFLTNTPDGSAKAKQACLMSQAWMSARIHSTSSGDENESDVLIAVPIILETKKRSDNFNSSSFDKGFHSPDNQKKPAEISEKAVLPRKGWLSAVCRKIEHSDDFRDARRKHSAVESSICALENHGLDRCPDHGIEGFKRYVGLAVSARDILILGHVVQQKKLKVQQRLEKWRYCRSCKKKVEIQHGLIKRQSCQLQLTS